MQDPAAQTEGCGEALSERGGGGGCSHSALRRSPELRVQLQSCLRSSGPVLCLCGTPHFLGT